MEPFLSANTHSGSGPRRRTIATGAAWAAPVVMLGAPGVLLAASLPCTVTFTNTPYSVPQGGTITITGTLSNTAVTTLAVTVPAGWTAGTVTVTGGTFSFTVTAPANATSATISVLGGTCAGSVPVTVPVPIGAVWGENLDNTLFRSGGGNVLYASPVNYVDGTVVPPDGMTISGGYRGANSYSIINGEVWSHGDGSNATSPATTATNAGKFATPAGATFVDVVGFTGGGYALTSAGEVNSWGFNSRTGSLGNGTLGPDTDVMKKVTFPAGTVITQISASYTGGIALTSTGEVYAWGINDQFDTGTNGPSSTSTAGVSTPKPVLDSSGNPITGITEVRGRFKGGLALTSSGQVLSWGVNSGGQLGAGSLTSPTRRGYADYVLTAPGTPLTGVTLLPKFYHEAYHSGAVVGDQLYTWGYGSYFVHSPTSQANLAYATPTAYDLAAAGVNGIADVSMSYYGIHVLDNSGSVWNWGYGGYGQAGNGTAPTAYIQTPTQTLTGPGTPLVASGLGNNSHGGIIAYL